MKYDLAFNDEALKEWKKLNKSIKAKFEKKLSKILANPHTGPKNKLNSKLVECYKIKLLNDGYRLVYEVIEDQVIVLVLAVGERDGLSVYKAAMSRR